MISTGTDDLLRLARERADFLEAEVRQLRAERAVMLVALEAAGKWHEANVVPGNFTTEERLSVERDFIDVVARVYDLIGDDDGCECGHALQPEGPGGPYRCVMGCQYQVDRDNRTEEPDA